MDSHTLLALLTKALENCRDTPALFSPGQQPLQRGELLAQLHAVIHQLGKAGVNAADRVAVVLPNGPEMAVVCLGIMATTTCVPFNPDYTEAELARFFQTLGIRWLVTTPVPETPARRAAQPLGITVLSLHNDADTAAGCFTLAADLPHITSTAAKPHASLDNIALVLHTSGSTAQPKIVPLTQRNLLASANNLTRSLQLTAGDCCLNMMPLFHIGALVDLLLAPLLAGGSVVITRDMAAATVATCLTQFLPTWYQGVPTMLQALLDAARQQPGCMQPHNLRLIRSVSSPLPVAVLQAVEQLFSVPVIEIYGMTETAGLIASNPLPPATRKAGSVGIAAGTDITIVDTTGNPARGGQKGEILVRGDTVTAGYEGLDNTHTFINGWLRTGDEGYLDADGYLFITGRIKDIINRGGEKISPREIDDLLLAHPAIQEVATFAVPHPSLGEDIAVAIVLRPGMSLDKQSVHAYLSPLLASYKLPRTVYVTDAIPKGSTGKIRRHLLAAHFSPDPTAPHDTATPTTPLAAQLAALWANALGVETIGMADDFFELGGDSLKAATFMVDLQDRFGIQLPATALFDAPTLAEFEQAVLAETANAPADTQAATSVDTIVRRSPLPVDVYRELAAYMAGWTGQRHTPDALITGHNTFGSRPPLFWVSQSSGDARQMSQAMGPDQPIYFMRSLHLLESRSVENTRLLAQHYCIEIGEIQPQGNILLCGFCEGGKIAFAIANQLRAQGRIVELLCIVDQYIPEPYHGTLALIYSQTKYSPYAMYRQPELAWPKLYADTLTVTVNPWGHSQYFTEPHLSAFAEQLQQAIVTARSAPPTAPTATPPRSTNLQNQQGYQADVHCTALARMATGTQYTVTARINNTGTQAWQSTDHSGIFLRNYWRRAGRPRIWIDGYTPLPVDVPPGARIVLELTVRAPDKSGEWELVIDLVEEGIGWFNQHTIIPVTIHKDLRWLRQRLHRHWCKLLNRHKEQQHA